jgi:ubiquitin-protein ligase
MINFSCPQCGKHFSVGDEAAGRTGKCKGCGASVLVPQPPAPKSPERIVIAFDEPSSPPPSPSVPSGLPVAKAISLEEYYAAMAAAQSQPPPSPPQPAVEQSMPAGTGDGARKLPMRTRRLLADAEQVREAFRGFPLIQVRSITGNPPDRYEIEYHVRSLVRGVPGIPDYRDQHLVEIQLTSEYPRQSPKCKMLTPIYHPNIEPVAICVGDHWTAGERLVDLIVRIGEIIAYQAYNVKSPLDGEAAMWAEQHGDRFPTDMRELRPPNLL